MDPISVAGVLALLVLVVLSAFFSSSESALFSLPDGTPDPTDDRAAALAELRADPHRLLVTILIGNNLVNMAIASITTALLVGVFPAGTAVTVATLLASVLVLVFGEIVPKSYGLGHAERWSLTVTGPLRLVERVLYPLVTVFDVVTRRLNAVVGGDGEIEKPYVDE